MCYLVQGPRLVLSLAGYEQGCHCNNEAIVLLVSLTGEESHQVHLRRCNTDNALFQSLPCIKSGLQKQTYGFHSAGCAYQTFLGLHT